MGFRFRKSFGSGPFRVNLSKSGVSYSIGTKGARVTKRVGGGTRVSTSIPGTGISYSKSIGGRSGSRAKSKKNSGKMGCMGWTVTVLLVFGLIGSCGAEPEQPTPDVPSAVVSQEQQEQQPQNQANQELQQEPETTEEEIREAKKDAIYEASVAAILARQEEDAKENEAEEQPPTEDQEKQEEAPVQVEQAVQPESDVPAKEDDPGVNETQEEKVVVYITNTGTKYHRAGCRHLKDSKIEKTLDEAVAMGMQPCGTCH